MHAGHVTVSIPAARWYIVREVDAMQQHLLHVAAKHGAAVVEPPGGDVWDAPEDTLPTTSRGVELQMQGFGQEAAASKETTTTSTALLPPSFTPSAP